MQPTDSITITKETNGNILVEAVGGPFTLSPSSKLHKQIDSVIVVDSSYKTSVVEFTVDAVLEVTSTDGGTVTISDVDVLFDQLKDFFFFESVGGAVPSGTPRSVEIIQTLNDGPNTISHNLNKTIISFSVKDGNDFVETSGSIIDSNDFDVNLSGGGPIVNATISFIYI
jgi:hypothetical protein